MAFWFRLACRAPPREAVSCGVLTRILVAGLSLKIRARLQGCLTDVDIVSVRDAAELRQQLAVESFAAVVVNETILEGPVLPFLESLAHLFHGVLIFCAAGQHSANDLRQMVQRHHVAVILQHPIDPAEVLRSLVVQLGLQMRISGVKSTHSEEVLLDQVWAENQGVFEERLILLRKAVHNPDDKPLMEEAWRAAHLLCGSLGSLGTGRGTLVAREMQNIIQVCLDGQPLNSDRLGKLVGVMHGLMASHRCSWNADIPENGSPVWADHSFVVVCDDQELLRHLEVEGMLLHWNMVVCEDLTELTMLVGRWDAEAVVLDLDAAACQDQDQFIQDLLEDAIPLVVLETPSLSRSDSAQLVYLSKPTIPYEVMMGVLRTQVTPAPDKPPAILVVDDDKIILKVVSNMLSKIDLYVQTLGSPLEFWDTMEQMKPDLVVLDVDLPPLGGVELCRALRADPRYAAMPVVFLSSYNDAETLQKCYQAGADDYLYKPVSGLELTTRITNRLERTRQIAARPLPAQQPVHPYSSLDQMLLRALRDDSTACMVRLEVPPKGDEFESQALLNRLQRMLRKSLRGEDVVKPLGPLELLVGMTGVDRQFAEKRLLTILKTEIQNFRLGVAQFPDDGTDLGALIELARPSRAT